MIEHFFEVSPYIQEQAERALERCSGAFARIEEISEYNAAKVLAAFGHQHVSESHFAGSTGTTLYQAPMQSPPHYLGCSVRVTGSSR